MAVENFTTYTEEDPGSAITKTSTRITFADLRRRLLSYVYKDKGVNFFAGDFTHIITFNVSAHTDQVEILNPWVMSNVIEGIFDLGTGANNRDVLRVRLTHTPAGQFRLYLVEHDGGQAYGTSNWVALTLGTTYYLKIVRDESVGDYGTLYCYVYSDPARTTQVGDTLSIALHTSKKDFRYIFPLLSYDAGPAGFTASGYFENLDLEFIPPVTFIPRIMIF